MKSGENGTKATVSEVTGAMDSYRAAKSRLVALVSEMFPIGTVVRFDRIGSQGIVVIDSDCPAGSVPVLMESGNVWDREAVSLVAVRNRNEWHSWVKRFKRKRVYKLPNRR